MIRMSGRTWTTQSSLGRSTCLILPVSGSFAVVVRFHTNLPMYFSSLRMREMVETFQPPFRRALVGTRSSFISFAILVTALSPSVGVTKVGGTPTKRGNGLTIHRDERGGLSSHADCCGKLSALRRSAGALRRELSCALARSKRHAIHPPQLEHLRGSLW